MHALARLQNIDRHMAASYYPNHTIGMLLYALCFANGSKSVVEIGYNLGYSAVLLCAGMRDSQSGGKVVSVDISPCDGGNVVRVNGFGDMHRFVQGDSVGVAGQVRGLLPGPIDFLLIDGDHSYEGCRRDWLGYKDLLHEHAIVLFHDNHLPAVQKVILEMAQSGGGWQFVDLKGHGGLTMARRQAAGLCIDGKFRAPDGRLLQP